ncbi:31115_t:CDS:2, partial [Gigaspora margarita]
KQKESKPAASTLKQFSKSNLRARILKELCKEEMNEEVLPSKDIKNELEKQSTRSKEYRDLKAIKLLSLTRNVRVTDPLGNHDKVWRENLACNIIEKDKGVNITFKSSIVYDSKLFEQISIQEILDQQASAKSYNYRKNLEIFYLDQLLNNDNSELITWQQLKKAWSENQRSKSWMLGRIKKKKKKKLSVEHWVERNENNSEYLAVRCKHCALNQREKENNCITEIKVKNVKGCIRNMTKNKENWTLPCVLNLLLRRQCVESPSELKLIDSIEIAELKIELINVRYKMSEQSSALVRYAKGLFCMLPTLENLNL